MDRTTVIPFGPQHPVLPEPLHLKLVVEDETVVEAIPQLGFVHRGLESLVRNKVRFLETLHSMDIIREALNRLPDTELSVKVKGNPEGESIFRVEQPRGELFYYIKANGSKMLDRVRVRTPTFANVPSLLLMLPGCKLPDVPVIVLSIDPCINCTER